MKWTSAHSLSVYYSAHSHTRMACAYLENYAYLENRGIANLMYRTLNIFEGLNLKLTYS